MSSTRALALVTLLAAAALPAGAEEDHAGRPQKIVTIGQTRLAPNTLRMKADEVLTMQNHSQRMMRVVFTEPKDLADRVKCAEVKRVSEDEAMVAGSVFRRRGDQVVGLIAPGAFVSVCSLAPGTYTFRAVPADASAPPDDDRAGSGTGGMSGEIVVE
jgi:hypothetical protein